MVTSKAVVTALILLSAGYAGGSRSLASSLRAHRSSSGLGGARSHRQPRYPTQKPKTPAPASTLVPKPKVPPMHSHPVVSKAPPGPPPGPPPAPPSVTPAGPTAPPPAPLSGTFSGPASASTASSGTPGPGAFIDGQQVFPPDNPWNQDISGAPVDPNSAALIASIGLSTGLHPDFGTVWDGAPNGIPYVVVSGGQPWVPVSFDYADESDPGPYPIPPSAPIEGGPSSTGDRHVLVIDKDNGKLYEMFDAHPLATGGWHAGSGAIFDLNSDALRPAGWTSADAAGLPIFPGLARYDEAVVQGAINHALRFTVAHTRRAYVYPARHYASSNTSPNLPPMGMRVRLKSSFNIAPFPPEVRVILKALKKYGMFVADNGSNWYVSGAPDPRWSDDNLHTLSQVKGSNFEVVKMGPVVTK